MEVSRLPGIFVRARPTLFQNGEHEGPAVVAARGPLTRSRPRPAPRGRAARADPRAVEDRLSLTQLLEDTEQPWIGPEVRLGKEVSITHGGQWSRASTPEERGESSFSRAVPVAAVRRGRGSVRRAPPRAPARGSRPVFHPLEQIMGSPRTRHPAPDGCGAQGGLVLGSLHVRFADEPTGYLHGAAAGRPAHPA